MDINILVVPVVGGMIGLFTNWLAIKMLFRPHGEKRFFGIRIPFTPGIIPKERYRLARKTGEAVSEYILTKDAISSELTSFASMKAIEDSVNKVFENAKSSHNTIDKILYDILKDNKDRFIVKTEELLISNVSSFFHNKWFVQETGNIIFDKAILFFKSDQLGIKLKNTIENIRPEILKSFVEFVQSAGFEQLLDEKSLDIYNLMCENDKTLSYYISNDTALILKESIKKVLPNLSKGINNFLTSNPDMEKKLNSFTQEVIYENVNKLALMFVNHDKIYGSIKKGFIQYLEDENNQKEMFEKICAIIDSWQYLQIKDIMLKLPNNVKNECALTAKSLMKLFISDDLGEKIIKTILNTVDKNKDINVYDVFVKFSPDFSKDFHQFISNSIKVFLENGAIVIFNEYISKWRVQLLQKEICSFFEQTSEADMEMYKKYTMKILSYIFVVVSGYIAQTLNIEKLIEEQVNKFELSQTEEIITSVIQKELNAITYLGGLLGLAIGVLTVILQNI